MFCFRYEKTLYFLTKKKVSEKMLHVCDLIWTSCCRRSINKSALISLEKFEITLRHVLINIQTYIQLHPSQPGELVDIDDRNNYNHKWHLRFSCFSSSSSSGEISWDDISGQLYGGPVNDLQEGDDAEAKEKTKEAAKRGDKLHRTHRDASLHFLEFHIL